MRVQPARGMVAHVDQLDTRRPFTRAQAVAAGITDKQLRGPRFRRICRGVYVAAVMPPDPVHRVMAALLVHPSGAFASHASAGRVMRLPLPPGMSDEHVSVFDPDDRRRRPGIRSHLAPADAPVARLRGLRISAPEQAFVELAEQLSLVDLVVVGDFMVRRGWVTPEALVAHATGPIGRPAAARAAVHVRRDVDSPMETRLRLLLVLAGLPEPSVNHKVFGEDGRLRYRFDLSYPALRIAVEYDGSWHREDPSQMDRDADRSEWLGDAGWLRVTVHAWGIFRRPDKTLARVEKHLRARGCPDLPRQLNDEWRVHFPVHRGTRD
jgi:hypothetical protein